MQINLDNSCEQAPGGIKMTLHQRKREIKPKLIVPKPKVKKVVKEEETE